MISPTTLAEYSDQQHCAQIPKAKANHVVFTLTDYRKDYDNDRALLRLLDESYDTCYFWPQGTFDMRYIKELKVPMNNLVMLSPSVTAFNRSLGHEVDYIGTRLHAGMRALQKQRRTIILGVDNRAIEKSKSYNITVIERDKIDALKEKMHTSFETRVSIPQENIDRFKAQFV